MAKKKVQKQILRFGRWHHPAAPGGILEITKDYAKKLVENFKHTPFSPVLRGHHRSDEADANPSLIVTKNITNLGLKDDGVYAEFEIDEVDLDKYNDVSASITPNYVNHETSEEIGPVLQHVALVGTPYIKGLKPFVPLKDNIDNYLIYLSEIDMDENKTIEPEVTEDSEVTEEVTEEVVTEEVETETETEEVTEEIDEPKADDVTIDNSDTLDLRDQIKKQSDEIAALQAQIRKDRVEKEYDVLLSEGKVMPSQEKEIKALLQLSDTEINLADGSQTVGELLKSVLSKYPSMVNLAEQGVLLDSTPRKISDKTIRELREVHPEMSEAEFEVFLSENENHILNAEAKVKSKK